MRQGVARARLISPREAICIDRTLKPESPAGLILGETDQICLETLEIDQEAFFTMLPIDELRRIGAPSHPVRIMIDRGDGGRVESTVYSIRLSVGGRTSNTLAVAFEGARPVLGSKSLEDLGLQINRRSGLLEPSRNPHFLST